MDFDMHVHDRGGKETYKGEDERHALEVAQKAGVDGILVMPNTDPPLTTRALIEEKLARADKVGSRVFYGVYAGLTADPIQIREVIEAYNDLFPRVAGMKLYMCNMKSLTVALEEHQRRVFRCLGGNYRGMLVVHPDKESLFRPELWNPKKPSTWNYAKSAEAELEGVKDAVLFATEEGFGGWLHFTHVSTPAIVQYINSIKRNLIGSEHCQLRGISCDATPHHLFAYAEMMDLPGGIVLKVNSPLRTKQEQQGLLKCLKRGEIDCIASDSAPHHLEREKLQAPFLSGNPGLDKWPRVRKRLQDEGFTAQQIEDLTFNHAVNLFGEGLKKMVKKTENSGDINLRAYSYGYQYP